MNKGLLRIVLTTLSVLLVCLFFIPPYHTWYWSHPGVFFSLTVIGVASGLFGSYLFFPNIGRETRDKEVRNDFLVLSGGLVFFLGVIVGVASLFIGYWALSVLEESFDGYAGMGSDGLALYLQISFFGLAVVFGFLGQFLIRKGYRIRNVY